MKSAIIICAALCFAFAWGTLSCSRRSFRRGAFLRKPILLDNSSCSPRFCLASSRTAGTRLRAGFLLAKFRIPAGHRCGTASVIRHLYCKNRQSRFSRSTPAKPVFHDLMPPAGGGAGRLCGDSGHETSGVCTASFAKRTYRSVTVICCAPVCTDSPSAQFSALRCFASGCAQHDAL